MHDSICAGRDGEDENYTFSIDKIASDINVERERLILHASSITNKS